MKYRKAYLIIVVSIFIQLKFYFKKLTEQDLVFITKPISELLHLLFNEKYRFVMGKGFYFENLNILISKSCSGYNLLLITFVILCFQFSMAKDKGWLSFFSLPILFFASYLFSVFVSVIRIYYAVSFQNTLVSFSGFLPNQIHEAIGVFVNLSFLTLLYFFNHKTIFKIK